MRQRHEVLDEVERLYRCPPGESVIHGWQERDDLSRLLLSSKSATGYRGVHAVSGTSRYRATYGKPFWLDALLPYRLTQRRW